MLLDLLRNDERYNLNPTVMPKVLNSTSSAATATARKKIYSQGGVCIISSQILVVDLLSEVLPVGAITGFLVMNAHTVSDVSNTGFALRLYRETWRTWCVQ